MDKKKYITSTITIFIAVLLFCCTAYPIDTTSCGKVTNSSALRVPLMTGKELKNDRASSLYRAVQTYIILLVEKMPIFLKVMPKENRKKFAIKKLEKEIKVLSFQLIGLLHETLKSYSKDNITVESISGLFNSGNQSRIYGHIEKLREAFILKSILAKDELFFLRMMVWDHDSPDLALCRLLY